MKKETKKAEPTSSADTATNHHEEVDDEFYPLTPEQEELANKFFATPLLYYLEISKSAEEFHQRLSEIILYADKLTDDERQFLANLVQKPWKPKRGAGTKEKRYSEIFYDYILPYFDPEIPDEQTLRRTDAIPLIMDRYKLTADAAGKSYDIAKKWSGEAPLPKVAKVKSGNK